MSIPGSANPLLLATTAAEAAAPYQVDRSLRFVSADSAYLSRTPSSAGNRKTWTLSFWVKLTGDTGHLISAGNDAFQFELRSGGSYLIANSGCFSNQVSDIKLLDFSAWQHFVIEHDATNSYCKIYINGALQKTITASNANGAFNNNTAHNFSGRSTSLDSFTDFYLAEVHMVDGQALAASDFGQYDSNNNWNPKAYDGTYGTNGFHLDFADYSDLGDDNSGNGNDWTPNNLVGLDVKTETTSAFSGSGTTHGSLTAILDNDTSTGFGVQAGTLTYTPASAITVSSQIVFHYSTDQSNTRFRVNSGSYITLSDPSGVGTYTHSFSGSLTKIEWNAPSSGELVSVHQIQIDDQILVNPTIAAGNDSLIDTPTNYDASSGNNGGNYATMSPVGKTKTQYFTEDANLTCGNSDAPSGSSGNRGYIPSTIGFETGKYYCECVTTRASDGDVDFAIGIFSQNASGYYQNDGTTYNCRPDAKLSSPGNLAASYGTAWADGDVIGIAVDLDSSTKTIQWFKNGTATGTAVTISTDHVFFFGYGSDGGGSGRTYKATWNFGQRPFAYTPPTGFVSLCTQNLPDPTIPDGSTAMDAALWTGNGTSQSITTNLSPDFVWIKKRGGSGIARVNTLTDIVRGAGVTIQSDSKNAEYSDPNALTAFNSNGFSIGSEDRVNENNGTYVGWAWDAGTTTVNNNTDGSITPTGVRANQSAGISIVSYTGNLSNTPSGAAPTVGHGLNAAPHLIISISRDYSGSDSGNWYVNHSYDTSKWFRLNLTNAEQSISSSGGGTTVAPTDSVFSTYFINGSNVSGNNYIAYLFAPVSQFSAFGSYVANGSSEGPFVYTNFRPRWIMIKMATAGGNWNIFDTARDDYNLASNVLRANSSAAEFSTPTGTFGIALDILSNGFKLRSGSATNDVNDDGETFIYAAFAEHPFKTARAR